MSVSQEIGNNVNIVKSEADVIYENDDMFLNIEINLNKGKRYTIKNRVYLCQLYLRKIPNSKSYEKAKKIIQINIDNFDYFQKDDFLYHSTLREDRYNIVEDDFIEIYHINLAKLREETYNEITTDELKKILYFFICKDEKVLDKVYKGDEIMNKVRDNAEEVMRALDSLLFYDKEELDRLAREDEIKESREIGLIEGKKEGIKEGQKEKALVIAKKMLDEKMSEELILRITGITKEELNKIK